MIVCSLHIVYILQINIKRKRLRRIFEDVVLLHIFKCAPIKSRWLYLQAICIDGPVFDSLDYSTASWLERPFEKSEVYHLVCGMAKDKALGSDAFSMAFFQAY